MKKLIPKKKESLFSRGYNVKSSLFQSRAVSPLPKIEEKEIILDEQQRLAVYSNDPNIIVIAGAGSGKTRVLTERVKRLLRDGVLPSSIVAITFTNMAADEMKVRLSNVDNIGDCFIGTIHSFANKIMTHSGERYTLFTDDVSLELHSMLINKYAKNITIDRYLKYLDIQTQYESGNVSEGVLNSFLCTSEATELRLLERAADQVKREKEYCEENDIKIEYPESIGTMCEERGIIDFDELLKRARDYFDSLGTRINHLLVDEFQDIGRLEYKFFESLKAENNFFVGDDWQAIYGFKGGNVDIFLSLSNSEDFSVYYLTNNYRNGTEIISLADKIIQQVVMKVNKSIVPICEHSGEITIKSKKQLEFVLQEVSSHTNFREWFILTRTNKELFSIMEKCREMQIPYVTFKREGMSFSDVNKLLHSNKVKVLTVHTSKGLEADNVVLFGNFPIICPSYMTKEEERKVMYVGVTRARKKLYILN